MKSMKKLLALLLAGVMLVSMAACGGEDEDKKKDSNQLNDNAVSDSDDWTITKEATCIKLGEKTRVNKETHQTETLEIPAKGHDVKNDKCTVCGKEADQGMVFELNSEETGYILTESGSCLDNVGVFGDGVIVGDIIVPSTYNGLPVVEIGASAFALNSRLEQIYIPYSVEKVGNNAFASCRRLRYVTFSDSVTSLDYGIFYQCYKLERVNIPNGVTCIPEGLFDSCESLENIVIPDGVTQIDDKAFSGCIKLNDVEIPDGVVTIGQYAFSGCDSFESVQIPNSVTNIDKGAFNGCDNLKSITLPEGITRISDYFASSCVSLSSIELPAGITDIGYYAFENSGLTEITIPKSVEMIDGGAFKDCANLNGIIFEDGEGWGWDTSDPVLNVKKLDDWSGVRKTK